MNNPNINNPAGYSQLYPYPTAPLQRPGKNPKAGGRTLLIMTSVIAAGILIGMALGLGLGIGAAGLTSSSNLIVVTNMTETNVTNATSSG